MGYYDFDMITERRGTGSVKYDVPAEEYGHGDLQPLWVADIDFETPEFIVEALRQRIAHPLFDYTVERRVTSKTV